MYLHYTYTLDAQFACFIQKLASYAHGLPLIMLSMQCRQRKYENV